MMKIKLPCTKSKEEHEPTGEVALIEEADYDIEEDYKVASYNPEHVKNEYLDIFHTTSVGNANLLITAFRWKTFKSAIFGVTWKPLVLFLILYYIFQIPYQLELFSDSKCLPDGPTPIPEAEAAKCYQRWHTWVNTMRTNESTAIKYLTFVLGFYVGQMIKRWWDQVRSLPDIDSITNCMAGYVQVEFKEDQEAQDSALRLRKKIVRYCLLSWTMCLASISPPLQAKFETGDKYVAKGLMKRRELRALQVVSTLL